MRSVTKVNRARVPVHALKTRSWDKLEQARRRSGHLGVGELSGFSLGNELQYQNPAAPEA